MDILVIGDDMISNAPNDERPLEFVITQDQIDKRVTKEGQRVMTELTQEYLDSQVDPDEVIRTLQNFVQGELHERLASGELNSELGSVALPNKFKERLAQLVRDRQKVLDDKIHWLTMRRDEHGLTHHSFPVASYRFGVTYDQIIKLDSVRNALRRLRNRSHIYNIKVTGPVPQHWYHGPISFD